MNIRSSVLLCATILSLVFPASAQQSASRFGLVIGNGNYVEPDSALAAVTGDAKLVAEEFRRHDFDVELKENLGAADMRRAIEAFIGKLRDGSTALFYFGGYGVQAGGQTYLIPVGVQITGEDSARQEGISLDTVLADMHRKNAKVKIVIVDAARQSPHEAKFRRSPAGLSPVKSPEGTLAIYSAALGMLVPRVAGAPSVFARELLRELKTKNRGLEDIFAATKGAVSRATNYEQVPWTATSLFDQFYLDRVSPAPAAVTQALGQTSTASDVEAPAVTTTATAPAPAKPAAVPPQPTVQQVDTVNDPAIRDLDARIRKNPKDTAAYYRRGQLYAFNKAYRRAISDFDAVLKSNPKDPEALNNRCWVRAVIGELREALKDCDAAVQNRDRYADAYDSRGFVNLKLGQNSEAIANYDAALRINTRHASSFYGRGLARLRNGNKYAGDSDIAAAKALQANIAEEFASFGVR